MKKITLSICLFALVLGTGNLFSQTIITVEAEDAVFSATTDFATATEGDVTYIAPQTEYAATTNPGNADKVATFSFDFSGADVGNYELYARVYVGAGGGADDSFYVGTDFGPRNFDGADWVTHNNLTRQGDIDPVEVVDGSYYSSNTHDEVWKWVNLSKSTLAPSQITYFATGTVLDFQIGSREDGLRIDKLVFATAGAELTVGDLDNGEKLSFNKNAQKVTTTIKAIGKNVSISNVTALTEVKIYSVTGVLAKAIEVSDDTNFNLSTGIWIATLKTAQGAKSVKLLVR